MSIPAQADERWHLRDTVAAVVLFVATATLVLWQNSRLTVLWDVSYILENAFRMSLGQVPYRDFPFPYAPLTFLAQAAIIKFFGRAIIHHWVYAAISGGLGTVLTWRIALRMLRPKLAHPWWLSLLLTSPLVVLGVYCVFPHPFYDPDCTLVILGCVWMLQRLDRTPSLSQGFATGALCILPLFVKQNTGLAFLVCTVAALIVLALRAAKAGRSARPYIAALLGSAVMLGLALLLIQAICGLGNYLHWTVTYAASRRLPGFSTMLATYREPSLLWSVPLLVIGLVLPRMYGQKSWLVRIASAAFIAIPCAWPMIYLLMDSDASERAERLLHVWPMLVIVCAGTSLMAARRRQGVALVLPFVVLAAIHGAFLSQQLWGSTYAIWPLLVLLAADTVCALSELSTDFTFSATVFASALAFSLVVAGAFYTVSAERLSYVNLDDGQLHRSKLPALRGLTMRGDYLPSFEELVAYTDRTIPCGDGILMLPGEDLFYYTTGRTPQFAVVMLDHTVNPYSPEQIATFVRARNVRWLIVKRELQLGEEPLEHKQELMQLLLQEFTPQESLNNYDVYQRK